jgi:ABC-2 type transport system permease protein
MIQIDHLTRRYGEFVAVDDVSFRIDHGEVVGLLGHNGAGKTTIMKMMTGFLEPTSGSIRVENLEIGRDTRAIQSRIGYLPENCPLYPEMTVIDYLDFQASLHGLGADQRDHAIAQSIRRTALLDKATQAIQTLSRGYRQRVGVAQAILHDPDIVILDEPTNGLDPTQILHMRELIHELAKTATVIVSTHILQEVQAVCDRVLILRAGRLVVDSRLGEKQLFAIDQFLMQGGSVVLASSAFDAGVGATLTANQHVSGLEDWLTHHGLDIEASMVLDQQNSSLPVPVQRNIGGIALREIRMLPYPHFPDIRGEGLHADNPITAALGQVTLNWASPITVDEGKNQERSVTPLLSSSPQSRVSSDLNIVPDYRAWPATGFQPAGERGSRLLAVAVEGRFDSFFKGKDSPLAKPAEENAATDATKTESAAAVDADSVESGASGPISGVIGRSPESARIILVASNNFADDAVLSLASVGLGTLYTQPVEFLQNAIDWSLEDRGLLAIRSRAQFARTLVPMERGDQLFWEYLNYGLALLGLATVWFWRRWARRSEQVRYQSILAEV